MFTIKDFKEVKENWKDYTVYDNVFSTFSSVEDFEDSDQITCVNDVDFIIDVTPKLGTEGSK